VSRPMKEREKNIKRLAEQLARANKRAAKVRSEQDVLKTLLKSIMQTDEVLQFGNMRVTKTRVEDTWVERHLRDGFEQVSVRRVSVK